MTIANIISASKELLRKCEGASPESSLKVDIIRVNESFLEYVNGGGAITSYEKRQVKGLMQELSQQMDRIDTTRNRTKFEFQGPPIAPTVTLAPRPEDAIFDQYEPRKISGKSGENVLLGSDSARSHVYLEKLENSLVLGPRNDQDLPWSVHVKNVSNCRVALRCDGPIILHNVESSVLILECHQLRIHDMNKCSVYAKVVNNRVIIENSQSLTFGGFSGADICESGFEVDDFDWPNTEQPSPHYSFIREGAGGNIDRVEDPVSGDQLVSRGLLESWVEKSA